MFNLVDHVVSDGVFRDVYVQLQFQRKFTVAKNSTFLTGMVNIYNSLVDTQKINHSLQYPMNKHDFHYMISAVHLMKSDCMHQY